MSDAQAPPPPPTGQPPPPNPYLPPSAGAPGDGPRLPWEERDRLGFVEAFVETIRLLATDPAGAYRRLRLDGDYLSPILFGVLVTWLGQALYLFWNLLFGSALSSLNSEFAAVGELGVFQTLVAVVFVPVIYLISLMIGAGILHLCLLLVGALEQSSLGFEGTLKVLAYASISNLANVVPFIGSLIAFVWSLVLLVFGFSAAHRTTQTQALVAVLIPVVLCCACLVTVAVFFGAAVAALFAGAAASGG